MKNYEDRDVQIADDELHKLGKPSAKRPPSTRKIDRVGNASGTPFMVIEEVQRVIPFSLSTMWRMIRKGEFPAPRKVASAGRSSYWVRKEVDDWVQKIIDSTPITTPEEGGSE